MILTHLVLFSFLAGAGGAVEPPVTPTVTTNNYAGGWRPNTWIAHINGKRYEGTYEDLEAILGDVVEATGKRPRVVIKPLRKAPEGASVDQQVMAPMEQAKQVQASLYLDIGPMLAKVLERRQQDEQDDEEALLLLI